jgi:PhnB protein
VRNLAHPRGISRSIGISLVNAADGRQRRGRSGWVFALVFYAAGDVMSDRPAGMRIGDSVAMLSEAGVRETFPAFLDVYVDDVDATNQRALVAGAVSLEKPCDTPYGDRRAMVRDAFGSLFSDCQPTHHRQPVNAAWRMVLDRWLTPGDRANPWAGTRL